MGYFLKMSLALHQDGDISGNRESGKLLQQEIYQSA